MLPWIEGLDVGVLDPPGVGFDEGAETRTFAVRGVVGTQQPDPEMLILERVRQFVDERDACARVEVGARITIRSSSMS